MLTLSERSAPVGPPAAARLSLPFELRSRSRLRVVLSTGEQAAVLLPRGQILRGGDRLLASDGRIVEVVAAAEGVSTAHSGDARLLLRAAYHLGNRHVALQLGEGWLRYAHDHVLDELVARLGLSVTLEQAAFEPEAGAYHAGSGHSHSHPP
ncbi:MAG TPA: urease accessory protein UreE [Steroidobacteraceae bacterium]|nr:urease accessory protein UreE [Steroidobacteraceae bacterium]